MKKIGIMGVVLGGSIFSANSTEQNLNFKDSRFSQELKWNQDMEKIGELVEIKVRSFLSDPKGNRININTKSDQEIQTLARLIADVLKEQTANPDQYSTFVAVSFSKIIPTDECQEFLFKKRRGALIENILDEVAKNERKKYGID